TITRRPIRRVGKAASPPITDPPKHSPLFTRTTTMPRPKEGYRNAAGQSIPAVGDINGRFMDRSRLLYWAFNRGKEGHKKLYDNGEINIGSTVHTMAELDLKDTAAADIEFYLQATLPDEGERAKAETSFAAFRAWRAEFHVRPFAQEVSLVSEKGQ